MEKKMYYATPEVEIIEVKVENGYYVSAGAGLEGGGGEE